jgi:phosphatidylglycerophosphate synthase
MSAARWQWPDPRLRRSALATSAVALAALLAAASIARAALPISALVPVAASGVFALVMLIAVGGLSRHHPFDRFGPANQVSTVRAALVSLAASLALEPALPAVAGAAAIVSLGATALDWLDGRMARQSGMASVFGARFDLEIDALLIMILAVLAWRHGKAGPWVLFSGLLRYVFVAAAWIWPWLERPLEPSRRRQTICVVQVVGLIATILPVVSRPWSDLAAAATLAALAGSFLVDILWLRRHAT